jgi:putative heme iron utilization protein
MEPSSSLLQASTIFHVSFILGHFKNKNKKTVANVSNKLVGHHHCCLLFFKKEEENRKKKRKGEAENKPKRKKQRNKI